MGGALPSRKNTIRDRFVGREELSPEGVTRHFKVPDEQMPELLSALQVFEEEYGVSMGCLRCDDSLDIFIAGVDTSLIDAINNLDISDSLSELNYRLGIRRRLLRLPMDPTLRIIGDYVRAWLGTDRDALSE